MPPATPEPAGAALDRDSSEAGATPQRPIQDLEHPWLGLESFREETRGYFFGREAEIGELHLRLRSHPLLVLYARSGLGKTSILRAGLVPRLRADKDHKRPLLIRLRYDDPAQDPAGQLVAAVFGWGERRGIATRPTKSVLWVRRLGDTLGVTLPEDHACRLWLRLHYRGEPPDITHLFLDQFEEVFTLGRQTPGAEDAVRDMMAILLQGAIPGPITQLIAEHDPFLDHFDPDSVPVRVILALRDDYVYALNRWGRHLPALGQNHFELRPLRGPAAFEAVFKPGSLRSLHRAEITNEPPVETGLPPIIDRDTAERIVRFIAEKGADVPLAEIEAVPPILSLLCRELNQRRFMPPAGSQDAPAPSVTFDESNAEIGTIIAAFYERCLAGRPEAVRIFIEEHLVSYSGARLAQDEESILHVFESGCEIPGTPDHRQAQGFADAAAARSCLNELITQRLLSPLNDQRYELIHDLLAQVVEKSRIARTERLDKEEADRRAGRERSAKDAAEQQARRTRRLLSTAVAAFIIALGLAGFAYWQYDRAERARGEADQLTDLITNVLWPEIAPPDRLNMLQDVDVTDPKQLEWGKLRVRSVMLDHLGDLTIGRDNDAEEALKNYRESLAIRQNLARQNPANADWQHDLSISLINVGDMQCAQLNANPDDALGSYNDALAIRQQLVKKDPSNAGWQRDLSVSYERVGDVLNGHGKLVGALESYRASLAIRETIAAKDPDNADRQAELAVCAWRTGMMQLQAQPDAKADARAMVEKGRDILNQLNARTPLTGDQQKSLQAIEADLLNFR